MEFIFFQHEMVVVGRWGAWILVVLHDGRAKPYRILFSYSGLLPLYEVDEDCHSAATLW